MTCEFFVRQRKAVLKPSPDTTPTQNDIPASERIFVNQSLNLSSVHCFGFDMDYTLCEYISPEFDKLGYHLVKQWLVDNKDYPEAVSSINYNPHFVVRYSKVVETSFCEHFHLEDFGLTSCMETC